MNVEIGTEGRAIPRKGIHKWDFHCSAEHREEKQEDFRLWSYQAATLPPSSAVEALS
jgi:hypothetical protein